MNPTREQLERELRVITQQIRYAESSIVGMNQRKRQIEMLLARMEDTRQLDWLDYV